MFIAAGVPSIPTNLNVVSTSTGSITLAWDPPTSDGDQYLTKYNIYYKTGSGSYLSTSVSSSITLSTQSFTADAQFYIRISAENSVGDGLPSASVYTYASSVPSSLAAPIVTERDVASLMIGWSVPTSSISVTGYRVYGNKGDGSYPDVLIYDGKVIPTRLFANISSIESGKEYFFTFTAFNGAGESDPSPQLSALCWKYPDPPPYTPYLISAVPWKIYPGYPGDIPDIFFDFFNKNFSENISGVSGVKVSKNNYQKKYIKLRITLL